MFWKLLIGTVIMLACGYLGEISAIKPLYGFIGGMCGWAFILFEIFLGEAGGTAAQCSQAIASSFKTMRLIVTIGWSIYPLGYFFGYLHGAISDESLNIIYNIADFVNKIAFVLSCWVAAKADSTGKIGARCLKASKAFKASLCLEIPIRFIQHIVHYRGLHRRSPFHCIIRLLSQYFALYIS